ncbi:MAG: hypoxanthine phosphoribosyltransferase [Chlorobiaceae bacterium]|nr:hypoxanthine phosphoribosyltransferase [Chlorobiaceae bacterium]NTW73447.1 hypoxanthine phosphoribosyltransferase [Chlorobiaceae bacterium]
MPEEQFREFISTEQIADRVRELGRTITEELADYGELLVVCVLKGAFIFTADLVRHIGLPCRIEFIRASSYGSHCTSSGTVLLTHDLTIEGRNVLLVEDIVDTGLTLACITEELRKLNPASLKSCCLLDKPSARKKAVRPDYTAFTIPDLFVVGYGLDMAGRFRELPFIGIPET